MTAPGFALVPVMDHEIHVTEWGDPANPAVMLWHGLARTGRDFDELAAALADRYFVICPDMIGRGLSSWSEDPEREYSLEYFSGIAADIMDHYGLGPVGWIGTSMGGLIGMRIASGPMADRLKWLIVNDIGPAIPPDAIDRILTYAGVSVAFDTLSEAESWFRSVYAPFGPASDTFWRRMVRTSVRRTGDGRFTTHYDPKVVMQFSASATELTSWDRFRRIATPLHVIAGAQSDILTAGILERMRAAQPGMNVTMFDDCGHAPSLSRPEDINQVRRIIADLMAG
ncbi:MAG: alpha/beta hydrolase [Rhodobacteraceae bacterium]|nr:alpha/beta hydrolase [Paracoccaceae bacterium]